MNRYRNSSCRRRRGTALIYVTVSAIALMSFVSLSVDLGRAQTAKTELLTAADAAARTAVYDLSNNKSSATAISDAIATAHLKLVDGTAMVLQNSDVVIGTWSNSSGFSSGGTSPNAAQVMAYRAAARGTAIPLLFGQIVGVNTCDLKATSIAMYTPAKAGWGFVGLASINSTGTVTFDSYNAAAGAYSPASAHSHGNLATNYSGNLNGAFTVKGNFEYGKGQTFTVNGTVTVSGTYGALTSSLSYANASAGSAATTNNDSKISGTYLSSGNFNMSSGTLNLPGGTYYVTSFSFSGGTINMQGPVILYVNGNTTISGGTINTYNSNPANFQLTNVSASGVNINSGSGSVYADIYDNQGPFNYGSASDFYGSVIAGAISITANTPVKFHYDESQGTGASSASISLVK